MHKLNLPHPTDKAGRLPRMCRETASHVIMIGERRSWIVCPCNHNFVKEEQKLSCVCQWQGALPPCTCPAALQVLMLCSNDTQATAGLPVPCPQLVAMVDVSHACVRRVCMACTQVRLQLTLLYSLSLCCAHVMALSTDNLLTLLLMLEAVPYSSPNIFVTRETCNRQCDVVTMRTMCSECVLKVYYAFSLLLHAVPLLLHASEKAKHSICFVPAPALLLLCLAESQAHAAHAHAPQG